MPNFKEIVKRLRLIRLSRRARIAKKAAACPSNHKNTCEWDKSANKPELRSPEKDWRLIERIDIGIKTVTEQADPDEFDEELLERIDFFACLFGKRRIE